LEIDAERLAGHIPGGACQQPGGFMPRSTLIVPSLALAAAAGLAGLASAAEKISYNEQIRPILVENCFGCHGADSAGRKADLRLDDRDAAVESGAIAPGDPDSSVALDRIFSDDPEEVMPPPSIKKVLSAEQKELLKRWIAEGAEYEPHWSFIPPTRPELPAVKNKEWVRNPIDAFILARLEKEGLAPAPEADRRTIARRLALDLTGLPPEPAVVDATRTPTPMTGSSTRCLRASNGASTAVDIGSTTPAMPTPTASTSTTTARCGRIGSGW
jgi:mono/diheme cytochrome c family protein